MEEALLERGTNIFIHQNLGFVIKKKSCIEPSIVMEFLGFTINSKSMTIFLLEEKKEKILPLSKHF